VNLPTAIAMVEHYVTQGTTVAVEPAYDPVNEVVSAKILLGSGDEASFEELELLVSTSKDFNVKVRRSGNKVIFE
jgi:hypothetical protein